MVLWTVNGCADSGSCHAHIVLAVAGGQQTLSSSALIGSLEFYDVWSDLWRTAHPMPLPTAGMGLCTIGQKVYAAAGTDFAGARDVVEEYDPVADCWQRHMCMHQTMARCRLCPWEKSAAVACDGMAAELLDVRTRDCVALPGLLCRRCWMVGLVATPDSVLYALGGDRSAPMERLNLRMPRAWEQCCIEGADHVGSCSAALCDGGIVVYPHEGRHAWEWLLSSEKMTPGPDLPKPPSNSFLGAAVANSDVFLLLSGVSSMELHRLFASDCSWVTCRPPSLQRTMFGIAVV